MRLPPGGSVGLGVAPGRAGRRAPLLWAIAAVAAVVALLGGFLVGVFDVGSGGDARVAAAVGPAVPATMTPPPATPASSPVPSEDPGPVAVTAPEAVVVPRYLRAQLGPDGLPVVPGPGSGAPDPSTLTGYAWPLRVGQVTQPYGASPFGTWVVGGALFHDGLDVASYCGDHVRAAHDGVVLPILHLNGYKISNPTVLARITREELDQLLRGYGWTPCFVEGQEPAPMH